MSQWVNTNSEWVTANSEWDNEYIIVVINVVLSFIAKSKINWFEAIAKTGFFEACNKFYLYK